jgi:DNA-binding GntR family transcriptional regulator
MAYEIDPHAPGEPSYRQLAARIRVRIEAGDFGPREPIPSLKYLVGESGLSMGTVKRAVNLLAAEGLVCTVPGRGTFVTPRDP